MLCTRQYFQPDLGLARPWQGSTSWQRHRNTLEDALFFVGFVLAFNSFLVPPQTRDDAACCGAAPGTDTNHSRRRDKRCCCCWDGYSAPRIEETHDDDVGGGGGYARHTTQLESCCCCCCRTQISGSWLADAQRPPPPCPSRH